MERISPSEGRLRNVPAFTEILLSIPAYPKIEVFSKLIIGRFIIR